MATTKTVLGAHPAGWSYPAAAAGIAASTTPVTIKAARPEFRNYVSSMQVQTATLGNATVLAIRDGNVGTVLWQTQLQTTAMPLTTVNFDPPLKGSPNTLLEILTVSSATGGVFVNVQGFEDK